MSNETTIATFSLSDLVHYGCQIIFPLPPFLSRSSSPTNGVVPGDFRPMRSFPVALIQHSNNKRHPKEKLNTDGPKIGHVSTEKSTKRERYRDTESDGYTRRERPFTTLSVSTTSSTLSSFKGIVMSSSNNKIMLRSSFGILLMLASSSMAAKESDMGTVVGIDLGTTYSW